MLGDMSFTRGEGGNQAKRAPFRIPLQGSAKRRTLGLVYFVTALAYHFCLTLPAALTQPGVHLLAEPYDSLSPCIVDSPMSWQGPRWSSATATPVSHDRRLISHSLSYCKKRGKDESICHMVVASQINMGDKQVVG